MAVTPDRQPEYDYSTSKGVEKSVQWLLIGIGTVLAFLLVVFGMNAMQGVATRENDDSRQGIGGVRFEVQPAAPDIMPSPGE